MEELGSERTFIFIACFSALELARSYIALLIGPLRMTIPQAIEELVTLGTILFPSDHEKPRTAEENSKKLKESIEDLLRRQQLPIDIKLTDARLPGLKCKT